jgi:plastocyanin
MHTKDLKYFETQIVTFVADKAGRFEYYCIINPKMRGKKMVE